jgi:DNA-binding MarR family transcriptional regulator
VRAGYLERRRDDSDRRARRVHLTERGGELVLAARRALTSIEDDYRALIGGGAMAVLEAGLGTLFDHFGLLGGLTPNAPGDTQPAQPTIGTLPLLSIRVQRDLMEATSARGHRGLKMSHAQVLPLIGPGGARVNELARVQGISRQAVSSTARDLEKLGVLRRDTAPSDGRAVVYRLTPRGEDLIRDSIESVDVLDARMAEILGDRGLADLRDALAALYRRLHLEQEIFTASTVDPNRPAEDGPSDQRRDAGGPGQLAALAESLREHLTPQEQARLAALLAARGPLSNPESTPRHGPDTELVPPGRID